MRKLLPIFLLAFTASGSLWAQQATVNVEPFKLSGPRTLQTQTSTAVIRDYVESWQAMRTAFEQNNPQLLDQDFVGTAKDKLTSALHDQAKFGLHTRYLDRSHDIQIVFYSPDGLSIQLVDNVEYDQQVLNKDSLLVTQHISSRYVVVLTPSELRWRVRIFQATGK